MHVSFNSIFFQSVPLLKERIFSWTDKRILAIAALAFACLATCCLFFVCRGRKAPEEPKKPFISKIPTIKPFGEVRKGSGGGAIPSIVPYPGGAIDIQQRLAVFFAYCFHTVESEEEIRQLIKDICTEKDPATKYFESYTRLLNNLIGLHRALPGDEKQKAVKIYWNSASEKTLLPYLLENEEVKVNELAFVITKGIRALSPYQADDINFKQQLHFVALDRKAFSKDLKEECTLLSQEILGVDIVPHVLASSIEELENGHYTHLNNELFLKALSLTLLNNVRLNLIEWQFQNKKQEYSKLADDQKENLIKNLLKSPKFTRLGS